MTPPILTAVEELECCNPFCGLSIHVGDNVVLSEFGWVHPVCDPEYLLSADAERLVDEQREAR